MSFMPSSSNKELSCVLFFAERKEETRLRHRVRQSPDVQIQWCVRLGQSQRHLAWHRRWESRLDLDLHVTNTSNYGCSEVRFRQYTEKREDFSPYLFQDEYSTEDCSLRLPCREGLIQSLSLWSFDRNSQNQREVQVWEELKNWELTLSLRFEGGINFSRAGCVPPDQPVRLRPRPLGDP